MAEWGYYGESSWDRLGWLSVSEVNITRVTGLSLSPLGSPALNEHGLAWTSEYPGFLFPE